MKKDNYNNKKSPGQSLRFHKFSVNTNMPLDGETKKKSYRQLGFHSDISRNQCKKALAVTMSPILP